MDRRDPKFQKTPEAGLSHLKSLMEIYHWQSEQGRWFSHEDVHHSWSQSTNALQTLDSVSGPRVTKTKQLGTFMTNCHPIAEELRANAQKSEMLPIAYPPFQPNVGQMSAGPICFFLPFCPTPSAGQILNYMRCPSVCLLVCMFVSTSVCLYICKYMYMFIIMYMFSYICVYICACMYICVC